MWTIQKRQLSSNSSSNFIGLGGGWSVGCIQVDSEVINYVQAMVEVMALAFDEVNLTIVNPLMCINA
jgi:hypothetical protein